MTELSKNEYKIILIIHKIYKNKNKKAIKDCKYVTKYVKLQVIKTTAYL